MNESLIEEDADDVSEHPLIKGFQQWRAKRFKGQTRTTEAAVFEAYDARDIEMLETFDRLLSKKDGAWIKHLVRTVRKNPELGLVSDLTEQQLHSYAEMRRAINTVVYKNSGASSGEHDWEKENELYRFAVEHPEHVTAVAAVMAEMKTLNLETINGLITERLNAHSALAQGAL